MAQRGFAAAFRAIFGARQNQQEQEQQQQEQQLQEQGQSPRAIPPDNLSLPSRYDTDGSSYEYEEIVDEQPRPDLPARTDPSPLPPIPRSRAPTTPPIKTPPDQKPAKTPVMLRRLGLDGTNPLPVPADDASSHYSLRPRRRRKPDAPEPRGVETSRVAPEPGPSAPHAPFDNSHPITFRPSRAALEEKERQGEIVPVHKAKVGPRLPAPSAATTSAVVARPDLVSVGNLDEASTATLYALCKKVGVPASDADRKEQLKNKVLEKLGERRFLNEESVIMDADGKPRAVSNIRNASIPSHGAAVTPQKSKGANEGTGDHDMKDKEHLTTTTTKRRPARIPCAPATVPGRSEIPVMAHTFSAGDFTPKDGRFVTAKGGAGVTAKGGAGITAKGGAGVNVKGGAGGISAKSACPDSRKAMSSQVSLRLDIPQRDSNAYLPGASSALATLSSTGVGAPRDMPPSPAVGMYPVNSPNTFGMGFTRMADGDPAESVDARGGGNRGAQVVAGRGFDMESIFGDLVRGKRRLSQAEYDVCLRALNENYSAGQNQRNCDAAALLSARGVPGTSATLPGGLPISNQADPRLTNMAVDASLSIRKGGPALAKESQASSAGIGSRQVPPVPPNTPGFANSPAVPTGSEPITTTGKSHMPESSVVHSAAAVLRTSQAEAALDSSSPNHHRNTGNEAREVAEDNQNVKDAQRYLSTGAAQLPIESGRATDPRRLEVLHAKHGSGKERSTESPRDQGHIGSTFQVETPNPFHGRFSAAVGGPTPQNTVRSMLDDVRRDDAIAVRKDMQPHPGQDVPLNKDHETQRNESNGLNTAGDFEFATPRDLVRTFNRHGEDASVGMAEGDLSAEQPKAASRSHPRSGEGNGKSQPNGSVLPVHLRGFSAAGKHNGSAPGRHIPVQSGRIMRLPSQRPKRPTSTSAVFLLNSTRANVGQRNSYIAEKLRKQRPRNERAKNPPLSASSLRILEELRKVREENRSHSSGKRTRSPVPVPPSVLKRARLLGEFGKTRDNSQSPLAVQPGSAVRGIANGRDSSFARAAVRTGAGFRAVGNAGQEPLRRLKVTPASTKKKKPIVYGSGRKRSHATSLSSAAVAELKSSFNNDANERVAAQDKTKDGVSRQVVFGESPGGVAVLCKGDNGTEMSSQGKISPNALPVSSHFRSSPGNVGIPPGPRKRSRSELETGADSNNVESGVTPKPRLVDSWALATSDRVMENDPKTSGKRSAIPAVFQRGESDQPKSSSPFGMGLSTKASEAAGKIVMEQSSWGATPGTAFGVEQPVQLTAQKDREDNGQTEKENFARDIAEQPSPSHRDTSIPFKLYGPVNTLPKEKSGKFMPPDAALKKISPTDGSEFIRPEVSSAVDSSTLDGSEAVPPSVTEKWKPASEALFGGGNARVSNTPLDGLNGDGSNKAQGGPVIAGTKPLGTMAPLFNFGGHSSFGVPTITHSGDAEGEKSQKPESEKPDIEVQGLVGNKPNIGSDPSAHKGPFATNSGGTEHGAIPGERRPSASDDGGKEAGSRSEKEGTRAGGADTSVEPVSAIPQKPNLGTQLPAPVSRDDVAKLGERAGSPTAPLPSAVGPTFEKQETSSAATAPLPSHGVTFGQTEPFTRGTGKSEHLENATKVASPFVIGGVGEKGKLTTAASASLNATTEDKAAAPLGGSKSVSGVDKNDDDDVMKTSTTPPSRKFEVLGTNSTLSATVAPTDASAQTAVPQLSQAEGLPTGPLFAPPASRAGFTFGGVKSGTGSAVAPPLGGFAFGASEQKANKDPGGPFGAPQFAPISSVPKTSTFVFGAASPQTRGAETGSLGGTTGGQESSSNPPTLFGSGLQQTVGAFASSGAFSGVPQFGTGLSTPAAIGGAFGSATGAAFGASSSSAFGAPSGGAFAGAARSVFETPSGAGFVGSSGAAMGMSTSAQGPSPTPFGASASASTGPGLAFGSSQPGLSTPVSGSQSSFGIASSGLPVFGGLGGAPSGQQSGFGIPFGQPSPLGPGSAAGQLTSAGASSTGFSFGASNPGAAGAGGIFNIGAASSAAGQPSRRVRRTLRGRRTLR